MGCLFNRQPKSIKPVSSLFLHLSQIWQLATCFCFTLKLSPVGWGYTLTKEMVRLTTRVFRRIMTLHEFLPLSDHRNPGYTDLRDKYLEVYHTSFILIIGTSNDNLAFSFNHRASTRRPIRKRQSAGRFEAGTRESSYAFRPLGRYGILIFFEG